MGNFYTNYTLRGPGQQEVAKALAGHAALVSPRERAAIEEAQEALSAPEKLRQRKRNGRRGSLVFLFAVGATCVYLGFSGWYLNSLPAHYFGYFLIAVALLGACGVNVWYGGPIDPRLDPPVDTPDVAVALDPEETKRVTDSNAT